MTGPDAQRAAGQDQLLGHVHRVQPHVLPDAHPRLPRHAAPGVDVQQRARLGHAEPDREHRLGGVRRRDRHHAAQLVVQHAPRAAGAGRSLGRRQPRVVDHVAAARVQLRRDPGGVEPPSALGRRRRCRDAGRSTTTRRALPSVGAQGALEKTSTDHERARHPALGRARDPRADRRALRRRGRIALFFVGLLDRGRWSACSASRWRSSLCCAGCGGRTRTARDRLPLDDRRSARRPRSRCLLAPRGGGWSP